MAAAMRGSAAVPLSRLGALGAAGLTAGLATALGWTLALNSRSPLGKACAPLARLGFLAGGAALARVGCLVTRRAGLGLARRAAERLATLATPLAPGLARASRSLATFRGFFGFWGIPLTRWQARGLPLGVTEIQCANV